MFEWDTRKANSNLRKHGVSFDEASTVFFDNEALDGPDIAHSQDEPRYLRVGKSLDSRVLTVAYALRRNNDGQTKIRIISARKASYKERKVYSNKN